VRERESSSSVFFRSKKLPDWKEALPFNISLSALHCSLSVALDEQTKYPPVSTSDDDVGRGGREKSLRLFRWKWCGQNENSSLNRSDRILSGKKGRKNVEGNGNGGYSFRDHTFE